MATDFRLGTELAGYRIESLIGRGGMSVVFLAEHLRLGRKVALKVLAGELAEDDTFRERFIRESRLAAALDHPNVITIYDAGEADDLLYISMQYIEGSDLSKWLRKHGPLSAPEVLAVTEQVGGALGAAHAHGLVHRDVKPANVLIDLGGGRKPFDRVFLSDFGITRKTGGGQLTRTGQFVGTVDYMAPEQISGGPIDGRADVYSLGCLLCQGLTGRVPFAGDNEIAVMYAHLQDRPPQVTSQRPDLPPGVDTVVERAMAKSKEDRFETPEELAAALRSALGFDREDATVVKRRPVAEARPTEPGTAVLPPGRVTEPRAAPELPPKRRRGRALLVAGVLGVVLASGAAYLLARSGGASHPKSSPTTTKSERPSVPAGLGFTWTSVPSNSFGGSGRQAVNRAIGVGAGIVAVGYERLPGDTDPAVWTSSDGRKWDRRTVPRRDRGPGNQGMAGVAPGGPGVVAVGSDESGGDFDAAVWTSFAGGRWARINPAQFDEPGDEQMRRVTKRHLGLVAVGYEEASGDRNAAVWLSADGVDWQRDGLETLDSPRDQEMWSVVAVKRLVVAVGSAVSADGSLDMAVWTFDGEEWSRVSEDDLRAPGDQQALSVARGGLGLVAVGWDAYGPDLDAAVWTSADGITWTRVSAQTFDVPGHQEMKAIRKVAGRLVAAGYTASGGDVDGAVWVSGLKGLAWVSVEAAALRGPGDQEVHTLVPFGQDVILLGSEAAEGDRDAAAWFGSRISST